MIGPTPAVETARPEIRPGALVARGPAPAGISAPSALGATGSTPLGRPWPSPMPWPGPPPGAGPAAAATTSADAADVTLSAVPFVSVKDTTTRSRLPTCGAPGVNVAAVAPAIAFQAEPACCSQRNESGTPVMPSASEMPPVSAVTATPACGVGSLSTGTPAAGSLTFATGCVGADATLSSTPSPSLNVATTRRAAPTSPSPGVNVAPVATVVQPPLPDSACHANVSVDRFTPLASVSASETVSPASSTGVVSLIVTVPPAGAFAGPPTTTTWSAKRRRSMCLSVSVPSASEPRACVTVISVVLSGVRS